MTALQRHGPALLVSSGDEGSIRVWDADTGAPGRVIRAQSCRITALALSPDGARVASGGFDRSVRLFRLSDGAAMAHLAGHTGWVSALAWAPCGRTLLSGSYDGDVRVWSVDAAAGTGPPRLRGVLKGGADAAAAAADPGSAAAVAAAGGAPEDRMVSALLLDEAPQAAPPRRALPPSPGDAAPPLLRVFVGTMDGAVAMWDADRCRRICAASAGSAVCALAPCADLAVPPADADADGAGASAGADAPLLAASAHRDGSVRAWRVTAAGLACAAGPAAASRHRGEPPSLAPAWALPGAHADWATSLARHRGAALRGRGHLLLISAGEDGRLATWRVAAPRAWARDAHAAFPDGFRAAVATFLLVLHRLGSDAHVEGRFEGALGDVAGAAGGAAEAAAAGGEASESKRARLRGGARAARPARLSPASPEPSPAASAAAKRRSCRALSAPLAGAAVAAAAAAPPPPPPPPAKQPRAQPPPALRRALPLHGATRDALVDLIAAALAREAYPGGAWRAA